MGSELERVQFLKAAFASDRLAAVGVTTGIGDDAAVIEPRPGALVWTIDAQVEGTHFRRDWASWEDVGWRSFMAAASDLAAMGADPVAALSALVLPTDLDDDALSALARGQAAAAEAVGAPIAGGNLARGEPLSVTTTLLGRTEHPVLRSGARVGDRLWLRGPVGWAAAGLVSLMREGGAATCSASLAACVAAWRRPRAWIEAAAVVRACAHAAIDVSDGLAGDSAHLAEASGVRLVFDAGALLAHAGPTLVTAAAELGRDPLALLLEGGEDYALLATSDVALAGFVEVGVVASGPAGVFVAHPDGTRAPVDGRGFDHFR